MSVNNISVVKNKKFDIGILGVWYGLNYGSVFTYYALQSVLKEMGLSPLMIEKPGTTKSDFEMRDTHARRFANEHFQSSGVRPLSKQSELNNICDGFIVGSDQVWNYGISKGFGKTFYLDFADDDKKKISYAASFGHGTDFAPPEERVVISRLMQRFDAISVREDDGVKLCRDIYQVKATRVLDPVFLANPESYLEFTERSKFREDGPYMLIYMLDTTPEKKQLMLHMSKKLGLRPVIMLDGFPTNAEVNRNSLGMDDCIRTGLEVYDWLSFFKNASYVLTDSFHGICFSILFGKPFLPLPNKRRGLSRFTSIARLLDFSGRLVMDPVKELTKETFMQPLDYNHINAVLNEERQRCRKWLSEALQGNLSRDLGSVKRSKMRQSTTGLYSDAKIMAQKSIKMIPESLCTGCAACYNICPENAIFMDLNKEGFWQPYVKEEICINCGLCKKACPAEETVKNNIETPECYAIRAFDDELRKKSSSGGMFGLIANFIRQQGGYVCGAAFTEGLKLEHIIISSKENLDPLRGSKYLQSNIGKSFLKIKKLLEGNQWVLFCGTPCQVAGLNKFLHKEYDKLITADVMCHGGSSPKAFAKYIAEAFPNKTVVDYRFREKTMLGWGHSENVYFGDGKEVRRIKGASTYFRMFNACISTRESCGTCKASALPRQGDFTLADAWGIKRISPAFDDGYGTSIVSVNSQKAANIFKTLKRDMELCKPIPLKWVLTHGQPMNRPYKPTTFHHKRFFELLQSNTFERAAAYTRQGKFDVAIVGVWYGCNYGSLLTYYSLYNYLKELGLLVLMVAKSPFVKDDPEMDPQFHSRKFCLRHYKDRISRSRFPEKMAELNKFADTFILGSDQVLHKYCLEFSKNTFLLNFVQDTKKKIAFSSSFGHEQDSNSEEKRSEISQLLQRFDHIGLREETGVQILRDNYDVNGATTVMDSIFLNDADFYKKLSEESHVFEKEPFIATYILDPTPAIKEALLYISRELNCKLINLLDGATFRFQENQEALGLEAVENLEVYDWLYYLFNAKFVLTDSYYGTCFSVLLNKNFITFANERRGLARFKTILALTGLEDRIVFEAADVMSNKALLNPIDYNNVNKVMAFQIDKTKRWLKDALFSSKKIINDAKWDLEVINTTRTPNSNEQNYISLSCNEDALVKYTNINVYLNKLKDNISRYLIFISAKDTLGKALNKNIASAMNELGIIAKLMGKHRCGFISVLDGGTTIFEDIQEDRASYYAGYIEGNKIEIDSKPFTAGNVARIIINGTDFSLNRRGLNFVIFDKSKRCVVDTVNFDTHSEQLYCFRVN